MSRYRKYYSRFRGHLDPIEYHVVEEFAIFPAKKEDKQIGHNNCGPDWLAVLMLPKAKLYLDEKNIQRIIKMLQTILHNQRLKRKALGKPKGESWY